VRGKRIDSLLGPLRFRRHYYHCARCGQGCFPRDRRVGPGTAHRTPAASEVASIAGVQTSFAKAAEASSEITKVGITNNESPQYLTIWNKT
jgi:hypothetical protein